MAHNEREGSSSLIMNFHNNMSPKRIHLITLKEIVSMSTEDIENYIRISEKRIQELEKTIEQLGLTEKGPEYTFLRDILKVLLEPAKGNDKTDIDIIGRVLFCSSINSPSTEEATNSLKSKLNLDTTEYILDFDAGVHEVILENIRINLNNVVEEGKYCMLHLNCIKLTPGLQYDYTCDKNIGLHDIVTQRKDEIARYAIVLTLQGILKDWNKLVGYLFVSNINNLQEHTCFLKNLVMTLREERYSIIICGVIAEAHIFNFMPDIICTVENHPIILMHDTKQLIDALAKMIVDIECDVISGSVIKKVFHIDRKSAVPFLSHNKDWYPLIAYPDIGKVIFSYSLAASISANVRLGKIPDTDKTRSTMKFILCINNLMNILRPEYFHENNKGTSKKSIENSIIVLEKVLIELPRDNLQVILSNLNNTVRTMLCISKYLMEKGVRNIDYSKISLDQSKQNISSVFKQGHMPSAMEFRTRVGLNILTSALRPIKFDNDQLISHLTYNERMSLFINEDIVKLDVIDTFMSTFVPVPLADIETEQLHIVSTVFQVISKLHNKRCRILNSYFTKNQRVMEKQDFDEFVLNNCISASTLLWPTKHLMESFTAVDKAIGPLLQNASNLRKHPVKQFKKLVSTLEYNTPCPCISKETICSYYFMFKIKYFNSRLNETNVNT